MGEAPVEKERGDELPRAPRRVVQVQRLERGEPRDLVRGEGDRVRGEQRKGAAVARSARPLRSTRSEAAAGAARRGRGRAGRMAGGEVRWRREETRRERDRRDEGGMHFGGGLVLGLAGDCEHTPKV